MKHARADYQAGIIDVRSPSEAIPADEPVFLLRGQDQAAAQTVRFWAGLVGTMGADPGVVEAALRIAEDMDAWPVKKTPDLPK